MPKYIDADALKGAINKATDVVKGKGYDELTHIFDGIIDLVDRMPTADVVERKVGEWIYTKKRLASGGYVDASECSMCHKRIMPHLKPNYCPNCGARMKVERRTEDGK